MQIILRAATKFQNPANSEESIVIGPGIHIQDAPDWIADTPEFAARRKDGSLVVVKTIDDVPSGTVVTTEPQAPTSGWGAKPDNVGVGFEKPPDSNI